MSLKGFEMSGINSRMLLKVIEMSRINSRMLFKVVERYAVVRGMHTKDKIVGNSLFRDLLCSSLWNFDQKAFVCQNVKFVQIM